MARDPKIPNIYDAIVDILVSELEIDKSRVLPKSHILNDLGGDSLQIVEVIMTLEEHFNIIIEDEAVDRINTVEDIYKEVGEIIER